MRKMTWTHTEVASYSRLQLLMLVLDQDYSCSGLGESVASVLGSQAG